ncbi:hypothetical protein D8I35_17115 [Corticibacter populi]|uniref:Uncharacterized protein n=1 Tax=Corticibacter populi TaxID=1550736 RepID=A0A3M6QKW4_9BURK|nr:hypothetical protein [Corticibacter populi]RMX03585.1 hypothetical protein D8I35_17115 [Corticibacter populi]RZS30040.1 hypothetical protein EV687_3526 [Corticibacter populi]
MQAKPTGATLALTMAALLIASAPVAHAQQRSGTGQSQSVCEDGEQDRTACRREMATVQRTAPIDPHGANADTFTENALKRCAVHAAGSADRSACEARVLGTGNARASGSVMGGGLWREDTVTLPPETPAGRQP